MAGGFHGAHTVLNRSAPPLVAPPDAGFRGLLAFWIGGGAAGEDVVVPPTPEPEVAEQAPAGRRTRLRKRYRIRLADTEREFATLREALEFISQAKKAVPEIAPEKARDIVLRGSRIGDAKAAEGKTVEVIAAPSSTRNILEDRIAELERYYWALVAKRIRMLQRDDEETLLLLM